MTFADVGVFIEHFSCEITEAQQVVTLRRIHMNLTCLELSPDLNLTTSSFSMRLMRCTQISQSGVHCKCEYPIRALPLPIAQGRRGCVQLKDVIDCLDIAADKNRDEEIKVVLIIQIVVAFNQSSEPHGFRQLSERTIGSVQNKSVHLPYS